MRLPIRHCGFAVWVVLQALLLGALASPAAADDLPDVMQRGVLRHLGIPYANFVTGSGDGLDVELMQRFANHLGLRYQLVTSDWARVIPSLIGRKVANDGDKVVLGEAAPVLGDVIANGMTTLPWRRQVVAFSEPTFPTGVWLVARADVPMSPIKPSGNLSTDIASVRQLLAGTSVLAMENTCLDPRLNGLAAAGAKVRLYTASSNLNEMVPAVLRGDAPTTLLDVPDALIALDRWPGQIKIVGPVSEDQTMAVAFRPDAPALRQAFNRFLAELKADGTYQALVQKYYPTVELYFPDFFGAAEASEATVRR